MYREKSYKKKCGDKDPDHTEDQSRNMIKCTNCGGNHALYVQICELWRKKSDC